MVFVVHSLAAQLDFENTANTLCADLNEEEKERLHFALSWAKEVYKDSLLSTREPILAHALGMALMMVGLKQGFEARIAALLFALNSVLENADQKIERRFGKSIAKLVTGINRLNRLRFAARGLTEKTQNSMEAKAQVEIWRKMLLAMVEDIRVMLLCLVSRTQTMRYYADCADGWRVDTAKETLALYAPLANRLGVWELKWELEDLSFRFLQPETYKRIAKMLDEKRLEREQFIVNAVLRVKTALKKLGINNPTVYGRPKHIYSIWNKMSRKGVDFSEIYDVRAIRVVVEEVKDCYLALDAVHHLWTPIPHELDDYIARPKGNNYQSLHTAVVCEDGKSLEIQIRTWAMHHHAELGVAAHWRYKENKGGKADGYDEKIALLRHLLTWRDEVTKTEWENEHRRIAFNEIIYVLTPQGKVIDLPQHSTPVDFAYRIHTLLGHRCRGAKVDGQMVALNTPLQTGQCVEIISAKEGGPSRDWLNPTLHYLETPSAKRKVRAWFANLALEETLAEGKAIVLRALQKGGDSHISVESLAEQFGFAKPGDLYIAAARGELSAKQFQNFLSPTVENAENELLLKKTAPHSKKEKGEILIVGVEKLLTQLARCCKPTPGDEIMGFVTRGKGVSIHRQDCVNFLHLAHTHPERVMETLWNDEKTEGVFYSDIVIDAHDRQGLLRDISAVFTKEQMNVTGVTTRTKQNKAHMRFTVEIRLAQDLKKILALLHNVEGVVAARRA